MHHPTDSITHTTAFVTPVVGHWLEQETHSERGNLMLLYGLLFPVSGKSSFICMITERITHTMSFVTPIVGHWLQREIDQWVHHEVSIP